VYVPLSSLHLVFSFFVSCFVGNSNNSFRRKVCRRIPEEAKPSLVTNMMEKVSSYLLASHVGKIQQAVSSAPTADTAIKIINILLTEQLLSELREGALNALASLDSHVLQSFQSRPDSFKVLMEWHGRLASSTTDGRVHMRDLMERTQDRLGIEEAEARFLITFH
jgi:hypothetical protein